jgi:hypothetical protein
MATIGEILINLRLESQSFQRGIKAGITGGNQLATSLKHVGNSSFRVGAQMAGASRSMFMFGISMKFFGMELAKSSQRIMRDSTAAFTKIMESSGYAGSAIQRLGVHFEYLKFVVGSAINRALQPLMPYLIKFIMWLAAVIQKHPKATLFILAGAFALGHLLSFIGTIVLVGPQMIRLFTWIASSPVWGALKAGMATVVAFIPKMWAFATANIATVLPLILIGAGIALGIMLLGKMAKAMGGWGELGKSVIRGILRLLVVLIDALLSVARTITNVVITIFDSFFDFIVKGINWVIKQVNKLLESEFAQKVAGIMGAGEMKSISLIQERDIPKITGQFGDLIEKYLDWEGSSGLAPKVSEEEFNSNISSGAGVSDEEFAGGNKFIIDTVVVENPKDIQEMLDMINQNTSNTTY